MAIIALNWETAHLHGDTWISQHRLRHRIFVERQAWSVPAYNNLEYDDFDTPAAVYLVRGDDQGRARGIARLIPTTRPYMVQTLWPDLLDHPAPADPSIWEATRFGCDRGLAPIQRSQIVGELICGCLEWALQLDIRTYLAVMPVWIFQQVLARSGCPIRYARPSRIMQRHHIAAAYIDVSPAVLATVRARTGIAGAVLDAEDAQCVLAKRGPRPSRGIIPEPPDPALPRCPPPLSGFGRCMEDGNAAQHPR